MKPQSQGESCANSSAGRSDSSRTACSHPKDRFTSAVGDLYSNRSETAWARPGTDGGSVHDGNTPRCQVSLALTMPRRYSRLATPRWGLNRRLSPPVFIGIARTEARLLAQTNLRHTSCRRIKRKCGFRTWHRSATIKTQDQYSPGTHFREVNGVFVDTWTSSAVHGMQCARVVVRYAG